MFLAWPVLLWLVTTALLSFGACGAVFSLAARRGITDDPRSNPTRKRQARPIPLLGGSAAVLVALLGCTVSVFNAANWSLGSLLDLNEGSPNLLWLGLAVLVLLAGGYLDDKYQLPAKFMFFPITGALLLAIFPGDLVIASLSYPFNSLLPAWPYLPELLAFLWLGLCLASTKFLDGHDGLVTTVGIVSFATIAAVALTPNVFQPLVFVLALGCVASLLGFLPHNFPNARGYLGEGASEAIGFGIGVLSIISGAKIATTATVLGWFILDMLLVFLTRFLLRKPLFTGDRLHWHFRLVDLGLSKLQVLVLTSVILLITAQLGLTLSTSQKLPLLIVQGLFLGLVFLVTFVISLTRAAQETSLKGG